MSGGTVLPKLEQFIKEREYVNNVSPATIDWYEQSLCWLNTESPTSDDIKTLVMIFDPYRFSSQMNVNAKIASSLNELINEIQVKKGEWAQATV